MRKKLIFFGILVFLFILFIVLRSLLFDTQNANGKIKIQSSPTASVFINNVIVGKTPFEDKMKTGEFMIKLIPESTATDTASWSSKVEVYKNALTFIQRELGSSDLTSAGEIFTVTKMEQPPKSAQFGEISVETDPQGSIVKLDNDEKGVAPLLLTDVMKGDHELTISMPGFFSRTKKINIDGGYRVNASFKLAINQIQKKLDEKNKSATESATLQKDKNATESAQKKTTVTVKDNEYGFLRVREEPSITASEAARIKPGDSFELLEEKSGWIKIQYDEKNKKTGWISAEYVTKE
jgi:hypothetical protein